MATLTSTNPSRAAGDHADDVGLIYELRTFWRQFIVAAFNAYRPELHYMRGPGPAWRAKHGRHI